MTRSKAVTALTYLFLTVASIVSVFPIYWMFVSATNHTVDVLGGRLLPGSHLLENYRSLTARADVVRALWNSFRNAGVQTLFSLFICSVAGYGFEIYHDRLKDLVFRLLLTSIMIPFAAIVIPLFILIGRLNLLDTTLGFVLPTLATAVLVFLFRQSARYFPQEIIEAARLEGMGEIGIFFRMYIPVMKSTYATAGIITFMAAWNNYLWPLIIMQKPTSQVMPLLVSNLIAGYVTDYGVVMLGVSISVLPTLIIFLLLQRSFAEGIVMSAK